MIRWFALVILLFCVAASSAETNQLYLVTTYFTTRDAATMADVGRQNRVYSNIVSVATNLQMGAIALTDTNNQVVVIRSDTALKVLKQ